MAPSVVDLWLVLLKCEIAFPFSVKIFAQEAASDYYKYNVSCRRKDTYVNTKNDV